MKSFDTILDFETKEAKFGVKDNAINSISKASKSIHERIEDESEDLVNREQEFEQEIQEIESVLENVAYFIYYLGAGFFDGGESTEKALQMLD